MKNKILKISLISVMVISVLVILTGCAKNENVVKEEATNLVENKVENKAEDTQVSKNIENKVKTEKSENEIVEELFIEYSFFVSY